MKKFLKRITIGLISVFSIFLGIHLLLIHYISRGNFYTIPKSINTVVFGHSHSASAFNDSIIKGVYNLSQNAEGYPYTFFKIKKILEENSHIENVLVEYTNNQITPWASNRIYGKYLDVNISRMAPVMRKKVILKTCFKSKSLSKVYNSISSSFKNNAEFVFGRSNNYLEMYWRNKSVSENIFNSDTAKVNVNFNNRFLNIYEIQEENLIYLFKIKTLCRKYGVKLYFVRSPLPQHIYFHNEPVFNHIKDTFFSEIPFLDFKNYPLDLELFADNQHLNRKGRDEFSHYFNDSIVFNKLYKSI